VTLHYHGTPITPFTAFYAMAGAHFCVSHFRPDQVQQAHAIGQSVMLDNGAYSAWRSGRPVKDWRPYYEFCDRWLDYPTTWAVIPDIIAGDEDDNSRLCRAWPFHGRGAGVWHMHESLSRLLALIDTFERVCIGSSGAYAALLTEAWQRRMDEAWRAIDREHRRTPHIHMLRGMQLIRHRWPFASVDSADVGRNHNGSRCPKRMRERWDAGQCPARFGDPGQQGELAA